MGMFRWVSRPNNKADKVRQRKMEDVMRGVVTEYPGSRSAGKKGDEAVQSVVNTTVGDVLNLIEKNPTQMGRAKGGGMVAPYLLTKL